jgi:hypothetical protein
MCSSNIDCLSNSCSNRICANSGFKAPEHCRLMGVSISSISVFCCTRNQNNCYRVPNLDASCSQNTPSTPYGMGCNGADGFVQIQNLKAKGCISGTSGTCCPFQIIP